MSKIYRCEKNHLLDAIEVIDEDGKCLCPNDNTRCHLEADNDENDELRKRISELERLVQHWSTQSSHSSWLAVERYKRIAELEKQNAELVAENERMKNCQNCIESSAFWCEHYYDCLHCCGQGTTSKWQLH